MGAAEPASLEHISRLLKRRLAEGCEVEVERLGTFRPAAGGGFEFIPSGKPAVFLAYAAEDAQQAAALFEALERAGFAPWLDRRKLLPGQNWPRAIEGAIETADFFIACLSQRSIRKRGNFQSELRYALDCARLAPIDDVYFIPVRLDDCTVPEVVRKHWQYIDLFPAFDAGARKLIQMIRREIRRRGAR